MNWRMSVTDATRYAFLIYFCRSRAATADQSLTITEKRLKLSKPLVRAKPLGTCQILNNIMTKKIKPIHPGEILNEEFLIPFAISQYRLAKDIDVAPRRVNEIIHGSRAISANTALRLAKYFNTSAQFWLNLQSHYELAIESDGMSKVLKNNVKVFEFVV